MDRGTITASDSTYTVVLEIDLAASIETVWSALTQPAQLAKWLAPATIDPKLWGEVTLRWPDGQGQMNGRVLEIAVPTLLVFSWTESGPTSEVSFALRPEQGGVHLTLTHREVTCDDAASFAAGWHGHLEGLEALLSGRETTVALRDERYEELLPTYAADFAAHTY